MMLVVADLLATLWFACVTTARPGCWGFLVGVVPLCVVLMAVENGTANSWSYAAAIYASNTAAIATACVTCCIPALRGDAQNLTKQQLAIQLMLRTVAASYHLASKAE
jgi:hypothetical protein